MMPTESRTPHLNGTAEKPDIEETQVMKVRDDPDEREDLFSQHHRFFRRFGLGHLDVLSWIFTQVLLLLREFRNRANVAKALPHDRLGITLLRQPVQPNLDLEGIQPR